MPTFSLSPAPPIPLMGQPFVASRDQLASTPAEQVGCGTIITRQFSLWPFGTRVLRLFVLVDPSGDKGMANEGLLRAMQQEYFRSEARSQTNALRSTIYAAHYVLRHHNRDSLAQDLNTAAAACAVTRGGTAYVALAGEAAALAWTGGTLQSFRGTGRIARPVGAQAPPKVTFWSAPMAPGDALVLACGAAWQDDTLEAVSAILAESQGPDAAARLSSLLAGPAGPARVLVAPAPTGRVRQPRRSVPRRAAPLAAAAPARLQPSSPVALHNRPASIRHRAQPAPRRPPSGGARSVARRVALPAVLALLLAVGSIVVGRPFGEAPYVALARQAEQLLQESQSQRDAYTARALAAEARALAQQADTASSGAYGKLVARADGALQEADRVYSVQGQVLADARGNAADIGDLALAGSRLFALDPVQKTVRRFDVTRTDQRYADGQVVLASGTVIGGATFDTPVAVTPLDDAGGPAVAAIDRLRQVVQLQPRDAAAPRWLPPSGPQWQEITAIAADDRAVYVLDGKAGKLYEYAGMGTGAPTVPLVILDGRSAPSLPLAQVAEVVPLRDRAFVVRMDGGGLGRLDRQGRQIPLQVQPPDVPLGPVASVVSDGAEGLYLSDPQNNRVVHVTTDGRFIRQIRSSGAPGLSGLRALQRSADGSTLFGVTGSAIVSLPLPREVPAALAPPGRSAAATPGDTTPAGSTIAK